MKLSNLTKKQMKEIADSICNDEPGMEGAFTNDPCGKCIVCKCRIRLYKNVEGEW